LKRIKTRKRVILSKMKRMALKIAAMKRKLNRMLAPIKTKLMIKSNLSLSHLLKKKMRKKRRRRKMRKIKKLTVCGISQSSPYLSYGEVGL
jgi:hypothetical protein